MALGVPEFRSALLALSGALDGDIAALLGVLSRLDIAEAMRYVTDAFPELVTPYLAAAGDLTATWYEEQPTVAGAAAFFAEPAELPAVEQLAANGRWSLTQPEPASALQGAGRRQLFTHHRDTVLDNAGREGVRWAREARPGACGFCRMQATRILTEGHGGAPGLYRSKRTARRSAHHRQVRGHDFCRCIAVPIRGGQSYTAPGYVDEWLADYEAVARDADGRLFPTAKIVSRMEARAAERGDVIGVDAVPRRRRRPRVVDLDAP